jgi:predicted DCC family thiol-disulfide oxidoreductase YuxK
VLCRPVASDSPNPIILYDGVCGLCNRFNQFVLQRDSEDRLRFVSLQSDFAAKVLHRHGINPQDLDTVYLVLDYAQPGEHLLARSDAAVSVLQQIGGPWRVVAEVLHIMPRSLRNWGYNLIAGHRYPIFGKYDACPLPEEKYRRKFLDL